MSQSQTGWEPARRPLAVEELRKSFVDRRDRVRAVDRVMFLGEYLDCRVRVRPEVLLYARQHPTVPVGRGERIFVELPVELCAVLSDTHGVSTSPDLGAGRPDPS